MEKIWPVKLFAVAAIALTFVAKCPSAEVFSVSEVTQVISPCSFECKLKNYPAAPGVRFQVFLKDVNAQSPGSLKEALKKAKSIELRDVHVRSYFRIDAHVWADGENLNEKLTASQTIGEVKKPESQKNQMYVERISSFQPEQNAPNTIVKAFNSRTPASIWAILNTKIDLSSLTSETSFYDSIEIIRESLDYRVPVMVFWGDIENNSLVYKDTPIGVDGFRIISAGKALETILHCVSGNGERLIFGVDGGIVKIGTEESVSKRAAKVYSITDLLLPTAQDTSESGSNNSTY